MYLRVRPPQNASRPLLTEESRRNAARFNALLFDRGWWSSRGASSLAAIANQDETVSAICDDADIVGRLRAGTDITVVTQGSAGSGKSHLLFGTARVPQVCYRPCESSRPLTPMGSRGVAATLLPALVDNDRPDTPDALTATPRLDSHPAVNAYGVVQRCVADLLRDTDIDTDGHATPPRLLLCTAYFTTLGWTDLLVVDPNQPSSAIATPPLAALEEASQHLIDSIDRLHSLLQTAFTTCCTIDNNSARDGIHLRGHLVLQIRVSYLRTGTTATLVFVDPTTPLVDPNTTDARVHPFYAHTEFALRSALLGQLQGLRSRSHAWVTPWEMLLVRRRLSEAARAVLLFTVPPSSEMAAADVAVLRFAEHVRAAHALSAQQAHSQASTERQAHPVRLAPLTSAETDKIDAASRPAAYRRLQWFSEHDGDAGADTSPCRREQTEPPEADEPTRHRADAQQAAVVPTTRAASASRGDRPQSRPKKRSKQKTQNATKQQEAANSRDTSVRHGSAMQRLTPGSSVSRTASATSRRSAGSAPSRARLLLLTEQEEERFRWLFTQHEQRARQLLLTSFSLCTQPAAPPGLTAFRPVAAAALPSPSASLSSAGSRGVSPTASRHRAQVPLVSVSLQTPPPPLLSVLLESSYRSSQPPSPARALGRSTASSASRPFLHTALAATTSAGSVSPHGRSQTRLTPSPGKSSVRSSANRSLRSIQSSSTHDPFHMPLLAVPPATPPPSRTGSPTPHAFHQGLHSASRSASGRWLSSVFIDGGLKLEDIKPSPARRQSCVSFTEVQRILPVVVEVHRELTEQDHMMAAELMARSKVELLEQQRRCGLEEKYVTALGGKVCRSQMKRAALPSPSRRFFFA